MANNLHRFHGCSHHSSNNKPQCTLLMRQLKLCTTDQNHLDRQLVHSNPKQRRAMVSVTITSPPVSTMLLSLLHFSVSPNTLPNSTRTATTQALYSILAPVQEPHLGWHQLAAPQKSAPVPQKLLPEQQSPAAHLALTIGPQVSPPLAILGVAEEYGGGFLVRAQSPKLPWQPAPQ